MGKVKLETLTGVSEIGEKRGMNLLIQPLEELMLGHGFKGHPVGVYRHPGGNAVMFACENLR